MTWDEVARGAIEAKIDDLIDAVLLCTDPQEMLDAKKVLLAAIFETQWSPYPFRSAVPPPGTLETILRTPGIHLNGGTKDDSGN